MNAISFLSLAHIKWKSIMITDKALILSSKEYSSLESMAQNLKGTGAMEDKQEFWFQSLEELSFLANGENLTLSKLDFRKNKVSTTVNIGDLEFINELIRTMSQEEQWIRSEEAASTFDIAKASLIRAGITGGLTALLYSVASDIASGGDVDISGRRIFFKKVLIGIIDTIGPIGVLLIGGALTLFFVYQLFLRLKNPPSLIRMKRVKK